MERSTIANKDVVHDEINKFRKSLLLFSSKSILFSHTPQITKDRLYSDVTLGTWVQLGNLELL
jgi:hypothetical protein